MAVDFSPKKKNRNWLARNEQRKVLMLVFLLGGVFWAMNEARKPETWQFIFAGESAAEKTKEPPQDDQPIDTRLHKNKSETEKVKGLIVIDEGTDELEKSPKSEQGTATTIETTPKDDSKNDPANTPEDDSFGVQVEQDLTEAVDQTQERDVSFDPKQDYFPGVKSAYLKYIRDNVSWRRQLEEDVLLHFLDILKTTKSKTLVRASKETVSFRQLHEQPNHYRGKLVTISGNAKSCSKIRLKKNYYGITHVYQIVVFPSGGSPVAVYCLNLPDGFPEGTDEIAERDQKVKLTGFFYKRASYTARGVDDKGELLLWPVLLAKDFSWKRQAPVFQKEFDQFTYLMIAAFSFLFAMIVVMYIYFKSQNIGSKAESYNLAKLNINEEVSLTDIKEMPELSFDSPEEPLSQHPSQ